MKSSDLLRIVDQMHHDKHIKREVIFDGIEAALQLAAQKHYGEESGVTVTIDRDSGEIRARKGEEEIDPSDFGRIAAQSAKQVMIQKIREAESNSVYDEYIKLKGDLVHGTIQRHEGGAGIVSLGKTEAILPRGEQIPGETHHISDRVKAVVLEVKRAGQRVKIILSRTHPDFVRRLFENEIPEIQERIIEIKAVAREAGYRTKIAVSSIDLKVDAVGACVGVRGSRIKNVVDELANERIDIVRWNDSLQVLIPNALQPAQIEEVFLYPRLGRAIVLVKEDQLSLAIGRRGQNVRLASKLVGWDIEIMTHEELNEGIEQAVTWFTDIPNVNETQVETFIEEGFLTFEELTFLEVSEMAELAGITEDEAQDLVDYAEDAAKRVEKEKVVARAVEAAERAAAEAAGVPPPVVEAAPARPTAAQCAAELLPVDDGPGKAEETRHTVETLWPDAGPEPAAEEQHLTAAQVLGEAPASAPPAEQTAAPAEPPPSE